MLYNNFHKSCGSVLKHHVSSVHVAARLLPRRTRTCCQRAVQLRPTCYHQAAVEKPWLCGNSHEMHWNASIVGKNPMFGSTKSWQIIPFFGVWCCFVNDPVILKKVERIFPIGCFKWLVASIFCDPSQSFWRVGSLEQHHRKASRDHHIFAMGFTAGWPSRCSTSTSSAWEPQRNKTLEAPSFFVGHPLPLPTLRLTQL